MTPLEALPIIAALIVAEGFFSGSELALVSADKVSIRARRSTGGRSVRMLAKFLEEPERILTTTLIGTNLSVVSATTVFGLMLTGVLGEDGHGAREALTILLLSPLLLLFGELIPKSVYRRYSSQIAPVVIHPLTALSFILWPLVTLVRFITRSFLSLIGAQDRGGMAVSRDELRLLLDQGKGEEIEHEEAKMIRRIFDFPEVTAKEVMVPLIDIKGIDEEAKIADGAALFIATGHTRLPVFHERVDDIVGVLHAMDLFVDHEDGTVVSSVMRPVTYVPPTQKVEVLMEELQRQRHGIAVVVDEYGGAEGMITVEDILEEIVGEIEDEHDEASLDIRQRGEREYLVSARTEVDHLNEQLAVGIPEGDYETLAGFLLERFGRIPSQGDAIETERALLTVVSATHRVIEEIQVVLKEPFDDVDAEPAGG